MALNREFAGLVSSANRISAVRRANSRDQISSLTVEGSDAVVSLDNFADATLGLVLRLNATSASKPLPTGTIQKHDASKVVTARIDFKSLPALGGLGTTTARIVVDDPMLATDPSTNATTEDAPMKEALGPLAAASIIRQELQTLVETSYPTVRLEGPRWFVEKKLAIANRSDDPVTVRIQMRSRSLQNQAYRWAWIPGQPGEMKL